MVLLGASVGAAMSSVNWDMAGANAFLIALLVWGIWKLGGIDYQGKP